MFVLDPVLLEMPYSGRSRIAFLQANVRALAESYQKLNSILVVLYGHPEVELLRFAREHGATQIHAIESLEPVGIRRDAKIRAVLEQNGIQLILSRSDTIQAPGSVLSGSGGSYRVFTPFYRTWTNLGLPPITPNFSKLEPHGLPSMPIPEAKANVPLPAAGQETALKILETFVRDAGTHYESRRDLPAVNGTSKLSPYLHLGILSARSAAHAARAHTGWVRELAWRDFYRHILFENPQLETSAFKPEWNDFPWRDTHTEPGKTDLQAWTEGQTGYPIIDAGMRQLTSTGWMHNRVRMIVASFLTKHLLIDWHEGERIFNEHLIDGDQASNNGGWQWATGCGVDAAPYFRVFNPVTQGEKFDANAEYIKRFVPELEHLEPKLAHQPWTASRQPAGYPRPIVELKFGRDRFLETAKRHLKGGNDQATLEF